MVLIAVLLTVSVGILGFWLLSLRDRLRQLTDRLDEIEARQVIHSQINCNECDGRIEMYNDGTVSCGCATVASDETSMPTFLDIERGYLRLWPFSSAVLDRARLIAPTDLLPSPPPDNEGSDS
jgi:hypothetical protein